MTPTYRWVTNERRDGGTDVWKLFFGNRLMYSVTYLGRGRGGGPMRWRAQDHRTVERVEDMPEFPDIDEAKAWVDTIVRLS